MFKNRKKCNNCNDIKVNNNQTGGSLSIIDYYINKYKLTYNYYYNLLINNNLDNNILND